MQVCEGKSRLIIALLLLPLPALLFKFVTPHTSSLPPTLPTLPTPPTIPTHLLPLPLLRFVKETLEPVEFEFTPDTYTSTIADPANRHKQLPPPQDEYGVSIEPCNLYTY